MFYDILKLVNSLIYNIILIIINYFIKTALFIFIIKILNIAKLIAILYKKNKVLTYPTAIFATWPYLPLFLTFVRITFDLLYLYYLL